MLSPSYGHYRPQSSRLCHQRTLRRTLLPVGVDVSVSFATVATGTYVTQSPALRIVLDTRISVEEQIHFVCDCG